MDFTIEIGERNYLLYLLLPHSVKMKLLSSHSRSRLDEINRTANIAMFSGEAAANYDELHRYGGVEQHDFPLRELLERHWVGTGYGRAIEIGSGSGYTTALIARHSRSVVAVELVPDMQEVIRDRCRREGLDNVHVVGASLFDLGAHVTLGAFDTAFVIQSLHHFHRRPEVFRLLHRLLRRGGRLVLLEPHHHLLRVIRLFRNWRAEYREKAFWMNELNWATHDFVTRGEVRALCRSSGFGEVRILGYWMPKFRWLFPSRHRRFVVESFIGRIPGLRHLAAVLAIEAYRL
jgi:SAM-dependent methyltransferase